MNLEFKDYCIEKYIKMNSFHNGLALVKKSGEFYHYIDKTGKTIIPPHLEYCSEINLLGEKNF